MRRLEGAYSVSALAEGRARRLPRPARLPPAHARPDRRDWVVASEPCALDLIGAEVARRPARRVVWVDDDGLHSARRCPRGRRALHLRARLLRATGPRLAGVEVHGARVRMGERLRVKRRPRPTSSSASPTRARRPRSASRRPGIPFNEA